MIITLGSIQALHKRVMGGLAKLADTAYAPIGGGGRKAK